MSEQNPTPAEIAAKEAAKKAREEATAAKQKLADAENATRSGMGTRQVVGTTRGRNTVPFIYEAFSGDFADSLPKSVDDFLGFTKLDGDNPLVVTYLIEGYNSISESNGSDPLNEYIDSTWPEDVQKRFKVVIRNYSQDSNMSIEDTVDLLRDGIVKGIQAKLAAEKALQPA